MPGGVNYLIMEKVILHCDMNNFYASVECKLNPEIANQPVAVCGNAKERHGIVLAKNYYAKDKGVKTGDAIWQAKNKCPGLIVIDSPHYEKYEEYSKFARKIYRQYTDLVEPMGLDECWLDVTASLLLFGAPKKIADEIREKIKRELGLTISVGVSFNKVFAKLGSDLKKPDATTVITKENFREVVWKLPISDLLGVGRKTREVLKKYFINTIGDIANEKPERLEYLLGKNGIYLYSAANGLIDDEVQKYEELEEVKSISHGITTTKDLESNEEVWTTMLELSQEIAYKLRMKELRAQGVSVSIRNSELSWEQYQVKFSSSEQSAINIAKYAYDLFLKRYDWDRTIRTVTVAAIYLVPEGTPEQIGIFENHAKKEKIEKAEKCMEDLNLKFGTEIVNNASIMKVDNLPNARRKIKYDNKK